MASSAVVLHRQRVVGGRLTFSISGTPPALVKCVSGETRKVTDSAAAPTAMTPSASSISISSARFKTDTVTQTQSARSLRAEP